jgi:hypothetical protein
MKKVSNSVNSGITMTVKELREALSEYKDDLPVVATWEGVGAGFRKENMEIRFNSEYMDEPQLEIDVENYG